MEATIFVVVGRLGKTLTVSKVRPIVECPEVGRVFVFREERGDAIPGADYITLPDSIGRIRFAKIRKLIRYFLEPLQILFFALKYRPNYINGFYTLPKGLYSVIVAKLVGAISVVSVLGGAHEITKPYLPFTSFWTRLNLTLIAVSDIVTTKGQQDNQFLLSNGIPKEKIFIYNGAIDIDLFTWDCHVDKDIDVLFVGLFSELKGPDRVLEVVRNLLKEMPNITCTFLGDGPLFARIQQEVRDDGSNESITLAGHVDHTLPYFRRSKLLIMPSMSEGLATAMLEAMACGCVPIVSNVGNLTDAAIHNRNAMIVEDYLDIESFISYATELLEDDQKRFTLAKEASHIVVRKYSVAAQALEYSKVLAYGIRKDEP